MANKRDIIAGLINAGGATKESLMEGAEVNSAGLSSQFTYLRLTGKFPIKGDDGVFKFITAEEWEAIKADAASRKVNGGPKKSPEERKIALEKRVAKLQEAFDKAQEKLKEEKSKVNKLKLQKADAEVQLALISLEEVTAECGEPVASEDEVVEEGQDTVEASADDSAE